MRLPPTTYEQRRPLYDDLVSLLVRGFLSHRITVGSSVVCLRGLNEVDSFYISNCAEEENDRDWMQWSVARSIWMMNGLNLLGEKNSAYMVYSHIKNLRLPLLTTVFHQVLDLSKKTGKQNAAIESYMLEDHSRALWLQCKSLSIPSERYNGIVGCESLGMNVAQKLWSSFNQVEDIRLEERRRWSHIKFLASANAPKGIEKLNRKEESAEKQEDARRQRIRDEFYYTTKGILSDENKEDALAGKIIRSASTPDELEDEMKRWVSGEFDEHDKIVQAYKNRIKETHVAELKARQERLLQIQKELEESGDDKEAVTITPLIGYTADQLRELLSSKGSRVKKVIEMSPHEGLYNRHVEEVASAGKLKVSKEGRIVVRGDPNTDTLMEDIASRSVTGGVKDG